MCNYCTSNWQAKALKGEGESGTKGGKSGAKGDGPGANVVVASADVGIPQLHQAFVSVCATEAGGVVVLSLASSATMKLIQSAKEAERIFDELFMQVFFVEKFEEAMPVLQKEKGSTYAKFAKGLLTLNGRSPVYDPLHMKSTLVNAPLMRATAFNKEILQPYTTFQ
ncbi:hypothetical protein Cgig2_014274 [Carnegiea gigantea]|uniref:Uncharacterized protein n=1 Tax=Carnegiea gigantea TaxID=171969 RepID=A0A9Q1JH11_9CARY|nr:hypothetical protein Cgig2_014274 [Carnegiea gigantea]